MAYIIGDKALLIIYLFSLKFSSHIVDPIFFFKGPEHVNYKVDVTMYKMQWNLRTSLADDYKNLTVGHIPLIRTAKARRLNTEITYENVQPKSLEVLSIH